MSWASLFLYLERVIMYPREALVRYTLWLHVKSNNIYTVSGVALETTNAVETISPGKRVVMYKNSEGECFVREVSEFLDGRFTPMPSSRLKDAKHV